MDKNTRKSLDLLPAFFRTERNDKFLSSTLDQFISTPQLTRIDSFIGSKRSPNYVPGDQYLEETNSLRAAYQLEPGLVVRTLSQEIKKAFALDDLLNQVNSSKGNSSNVDRTLNPKFYSYDPKIDWDKFVNFREYYWLPSGPDVILISGEQKATKTEFTVTDASDKIQFLFNGLATTDQLTLYRGTTYVFNLESVHNFYIKYSNVPGPVDLISSNVVNNGIKKGQIIFTVDYQLPDRLYYSAEQDQLAVGIINIKDPLENTSINVEEEILGNKNYTSFDGIEFINGLKVRFVGTVFPSEYAENDYIVEGVGKSIQLVKFRDLETPDIVPDTYNTRFDGTNFDEFPFDNFSNIPLVPEYITINKASKDLNPWSRYNRWFHSDVLRITSKINNPSSPEPDYPVEYRATRPIIEFEANLQLYKFGSTAIPNIDLIDENTQNVFFNIENQPGYYVDGVLLEEGFRVIFNASVDPIVKGKIFRVHFVKIDNKFRLDLIPEDDVIESGAVVLIKKGVNNKGSSWFFDGNSWIKGQQREARNQSPLFDLFDSAGNSFSGNHYTTDFKGNKIFGYSVGTGVSDSVLGFPLKYKNLGIEGTYLFENYFSTDEFLLVKNNVTSSLSTSQTFIQRYYPSSEFLTVWSETEEYHISKFDDQYDTPINLTNNPLNLPIAQFTLSEISDHVNSMVTRNSEFVGDFPGVSNLKSLPDISRFGTRLISNINPLGFAHHFFTDQENNLVNAIRQTGEAYYQFKFNFLKAISSVDQTATPRDALDVAINSLNLNKTTTFPYFYSDMLGHSTPSVTHNYKVSDSQNKKYPIPVTFFSNKLSLESLLVYVNGNQLLIGLDYQFDEYSENIEILASLERADVIEIRYYRDTTGSFIPPTPTKLGLYPKFAPKKYLDNTFADEPKNVIQGHDGSLTLAFNDYRDDIILEFEKRIFNNIKTEYKHDLFDFNSILPGFFRNNEFSYNEILDPIHQDFLKWTSTYSVEADVNLTFDIDLARTFNFSNTLNEHGDALPGNWRAIFRLYFDTDRPHTHPWEMLGFGEEPSWWEAAYGTAPFTSNNLILWNDLEKGYIRSGSRKGFDATYSRPGLSSMIPVDDEGNLVDIRTWGIVGKNGFLEGVDNNWKFGDCGPAENAWRRSSYWPFAIQILMAVSKPALYSALCYDTSRVVKNIVGHLVYSEDNLFLSHLRVLVPYDTQNGNLVLTSGYSVFVVESGLIRNTNYISTLKESLSNSTFNLMSKIGGFVSKDKLEIVVDSVNPNSVSPGILLPIEDYSIHFNVSNPVKVVSISGLLIQKNENQFIVRGYDKIDPYFRIFNPILQTMDRSVTVGGKPEDYMAWAPNVYYPIGQVVYYDGKFFRANNNHNSGLSFNIKNYQAISQLPIINGITVQIPKMFDTEYTDIPYGTSFSSIQEVANFISGYSKYLESEGFVFDGFSKELNEILNWELSIKEFAYWATQNWANNSIIALSPFATSINFQFQDSTIDNVLSSFYDYSIYKADGYALPFNQLSISRTDGRCILSTSSFENGIFFARFRLVQKEHALIFNNLTKFNDVIYDIETGYRQRRIRLIGFRTANWDGSFFSPGFVYDSAKIQSWKPYQDYIAGDVVEYAGNYYSLDRSLPGTETFNLSNWNKLGKKPVAQLLPNFEYKINQFEDFYSLDIDNFDYSQQQLSQHLIGYSSRVYLNNIFFNEIAQYKFYQGFIREKGTRNALNKLARASVHNLQGKVDFNEEWAFRVGYFGAFSSLQELEFPLEERKFVDNVQLIKFVNKNPSIEFDTTAYVTPSDLTIKPYEYDSTSVFFTKSIEDNLQPFVLPVAGYVRLDDVDYAIKTKEDLLTLNPGNTVTRGDTFWVGFDDSGDWGAYRYARIRAAVTTAFEYVSGQSIAFKTDVYHGLKVGDIIAITRLDSALNGVRVVKEIPHLDEFVVYTSISVPQLTAEYGIIFKFISSRFEKFDDLVDETFITDFKTGKKIWIDSNKDGKWEVYEKINNYNSLVLKNPIVADSVSFGQEIVSKEDSTLLVTSAPDYLDEIGSGRVYIFTNVDGTIKSITNFTINSFNNEYYNSVSGPSAKLGTGLDFDSVDGVIVSGAPFASNTRSNFGEVTTENSLSENTNEGLVIISTLDISGTRELRHQIISSPSPESNLEFGSSLFISSSATHKILLVGAPGKTNNTGAVYSYNVAYAQDIDTLETAVTATITTQISLPVSGLGLTSGSRFGTIIAGNKSGSRVAVSAPGYDSGNGAVFVYWGLTTSGSYPTVQTLLWNDTPLASEIPSGSAFGYDVDMDDSGNWLFVSAYTASDRTLETGKVIIYKWNGTEFEFSQILRNPSSTPGMKFGHSIESDASGNILTIGAQGSNYFLGGTFDNDTTSFDSESTQFGTLAEDSGSVYVYNRYENKFIFATELFDNNVTALSKYGFTVSANRNAIYVSSPFYVTNQAIKGGSILVWNAKDPNANSWKLLRQQDDLVDVDKIKQVKTIDVYKDIVNDYLEIFDPLKGKFPQLADQEIRYKTVFDPAVYNTGTSNSVIIDSTTVWKDDHVGELWWDLSSTKYVWYEQGETDFRKNSWGTLFPGCSIDIYEWVKSDFSPSDWASNADTSAGIAEGISGQPKYVNEEAYVKEQVYSPVTNLYSNIYYFWVKNTVIVPNRQGRTISAYDVSLLISDPKFYSLKYIQPLSKNSLAVVNAKGSLINSRTVLNIQLDNIDNQQNKHTEWLLLEEGSASSLPNTLLEKKFIDSLLGRDSLGNPVPDPSLSVRQRYGIEIRPRQSMFKNRLSALRNLIDYANYVFEENLITDFSNFTNLNSKEEIPDINLREFDKIVEDVDQRDLIYFRDFVQAELSCEIENGRISSVTIVNPGVGYGTLVELKNGNWKGPTIEIFNDTNGAYLESEIDSLGRIVVVNIVDSGEGYVEVPQLFVRPYTVLVTSDASSRGKWAKYSVVNGDWLKSQTQSFDTTLYWNYIDWKSKDFNNYQKISYTVDERYQLSRLDLTPGDYVKINNIGGGRFAILRKTEAGTLGTFDVNFDIVYSEKGTISISDSIWGYTSSQLGFDQISPYDSTFFDQTPDVELEKILLAIKEDLFVGNLKVYWNKFFFAGVKFALTEQKSLDWAFKTSFISVNNLAGSLAQRSVYKFQDTQWYEDYLSEIKPYHSTIRSYTLTYDLLEPSKTFTTDFDLPVVYDKDLDKYQSLELDNPLIQTYPYKGWYDNRTLYIESIVVDDGGSGYTAVPNVEIIAASTDPVVRDAKAFAVISGGKVVRFEVTDPGEGYITTPTIIITGGGLISGGTTARATAKMTNGKVRSSNVQIKFDRISRAKEVGSKTVLDSFIANGIQTSFNLTWPANLDKTEVEVKINGIIVASSYFDLIKFTSSEEGYTKAYTKLELTEAPSNNSVVTVSYSKSFEIYSAYDRIADYFTEVPNFSPGANPNENYAQLMKGMEYPGTIIETPNLKYDFSWNVVPFNTNKWDLAGLTNDDLDVVVDGGSVATTGTTTKVFSTARGISPSDIIFDGDTFISPSRNYAPEELVPGELGENVGVSVFTRNLEGSAAIYTQFAEVNAGEDATIQLTIRPASLGALTVTFNQQLLRYYNGEPRLIEFVTTTDPQVGEYMVDLASNTIFIVAHNEPGVVAITIMDTGGTGFISQNTEITEGSDIGVVFGYCGYSSVKSAYVTVDGQRCYEYNSGVVRSLYYILTPEFENGTGRPKVTVHGLGLEGKRTITASFFTAKYKGFSEVFEQRIDDVRAGQRIIDLIQSPGELGPKSANSIVEYNGSRLIPPNTTYYEITNVDQTTFEISDRENYISDKFDKTLLEVFINGRVVPPGGYFLNDDSNEIIFPENTFVIGDVLAITTLIDYDYIIRNDTIEITERVPLVLPNYVRIITFTTQDASLIRTEVYKSNSSRLYKLSRQVINDNFIWISVGGRSLVSGQDFEIQSDYLTIQLDQDIPYVEGEQVIITSFTENTASRTTGYRITKDTLGRSQFKRLSKAGTTYLTKPLQLTDTSIEVENGGVLPEASLAYNIPGVILIAGERIEYMEKSGNVLTKLKRATFGTGAKEYYAIGTWVIDQGRSQTVPFTDNVVVQVLSTTSATLLINTSTFSFVGGPSLHDQLEIWKNGALLQKPTAVGVVREYHDATSSYDPVNITVLQPDFTITGTTSTAILTLSVVPTLDDEITLVQRRSQTWYSPVNASLLDSNSVPATFVNETDAITPDMLYYGGDTTLRFDDQTALTFDDGREIKGY